MNLKNESEKVAAKIFSKGMFCLYITVENSIEISAVPLPGFYVYGDRA